MFTTFPQCNFSLEFPKIVKIINMLSLTECEREFRNDALWDTHQHAPGLLSRKTNIWRGENMDKIWQHHPCRIYSPFITGLQQRRGWAGREYELLYNARYTGKAHPHQRIKWNSCIVLWRPSCLSTQIQNYQIDLAIQSALGEPLGERSMVYRWQQDRAPWGNPGRLSIFRGSITIIEFSVKSFALFM